MSTPYSSGGLRIGDAERDRAAADLGEHYALGRLSDVEHTERLDAIWTARTGADLSAIFEDLPATQPAPPRAPERSGGRGWHSIPFLPIVAALVLLSVLTGLPFWILIFVAGSLLFRMRARSWRAGGGRGAPPSMCAWRGPQHHR